MVKVKEQAHILSDGTIDLNAWLMHIRKKGHYKDENLIRNAAIITQLAAEAEPAAKSGVSCLQQGLAQAEILADFELDPASLAAAIITETLHANLLSLEDIQEQLGEDVAKLVEGVQRMETLHALMQESKQPNSTQIENLRKMLVAMVDDPRVVFIQLAHQLQILRSAHHFPPAMLQQIAHETMVVYVPLANRLGIGQLKWQLEDLAFRYLEPDAYKKIAAGLKSRRLERDAYVTEIVSTLKGLLENDDIHHADVYGRSKHIFGIHKKMMRKQVPLEEIYDATAVRVLVASVEDCYRVLSLVHAEWDPIPIEFDDYISNPKPNGYRSLHTAVVGPEKRTFEVQIRTHAMHESAEMGVAAHWRYKEGTTAPPQTAESKIDWLREVIAWQKELAEEQAEYTPLESQFFEERVYVFTPAGDIMDLPKGATPLDFAYHVHSEVGHKCRGAKVNGKIVPLTYTLKTGETIEILTAKNATPSRDWLNPHLGYLKTSRAKTKAHHYFKTLEYERHLEAGEELVQKELKKLGVKQIDLNVYAKKFHFKKEKDLIAAIGAGDVGIKAFSNSVLQTIQPTPEAEIPITPAKPAPHSKTAPSKDDITIQGIGNLLTQIARCCKPIHGDPIIGYITRGRGVTIHRQDCPNILHATETQRQRFIKVDWGETQKENYQVDLGLKSYDRPGLLRDVTQLLSGENTNILSMQTTVDKANHSVNVTLTIEINSIASLNRLLDKLKQIENVTEVFRVG